MSSCSVFEDRRACPCLLILQMDDPSNKVADSLCFLLGGDGFADSFWAKSDVNAVQRQIKYRGDMRINALSEGAACDLVGDNMIIPLGEQCPEAYLFAVDCNIDSEEHTENVRLSKNYCGISMTFVTDIPENYVVKVMGNVCGYDSGGGLIEGDFEYPPEFRPSSLESSSESETESSSETYFRVPRQKDASLMLAISRGDSSDGRVHYFALGNYILESGYDWTKVDLDDIAISLDFVSYTLSLYVNDWSKEFDIDVII